MTVRFTPDSIQDERDTKRSSAIPQTTKSAVRFMPDPVDTPLQEPEKRGFFKTIAQEIAKPALRLTSNVMAAGGIMSGKSKEEAIRSRDFGWFGKDIQPVGVSGNTGRDMLDALGTGTELASTVIPTSKIGAIGKATLKGKILKGAGEGVKAGGIGGTLFGAGREMQNPEATVGSVAAESAIGGVTGAVGGTIIGGVLPVAGAAARMVSPTVRAETSAGTMQRVARINPPDQVKFKKTSGEDVGEYLTKRGIYGTREQIIEQLYKEFERSKNIADTELSKLQGAFNVQPVDTALTELLEREMNISTVGAPSRNLSRVQELFQKNKREGLTMSEINEAKRLYERNVKMDYLKQNIPDKVERANTIDRAIRNWQFKQAEEMGFKNLPEINKNTQSSYLLADALWKKTTGQQANNALRLTEAVLLAGGNVQNVFMAGARRLLSSEALRSKFAKQIMPDSRRIPQVVAQNVEVPQQLRLPPPNRGVIRTPDDRTPIPVAPRDSTILYPNKAVQVGGDAPTALPQAGTPSEPYRPYDLYEPQGTINSGRPAQSRFKVRDETVPAIPMSKLTPPNVAYRSNKNSDAINMATASIPTQEKSAKMSKGIPTTTLKTKTTNAIPASVAPKVRAAVDTASGSASRAGSVNKKATQEKNVLSAKKESQSNVPKSSKNTTLPKTKKSDDMPTIKARGGSVATLAQQAKKYKSAEEFVKAQGEVVYHQSTKKGKPDFDAFLGTARFNEAYPKEFGDELTEIVVPKNAKILRLDEASKEAREFMVDATRRVFPKDEQYRKDLLTKPIIPDQEDGVARDFYNDIWTEKIHAIDALKSGKYDYDAVLFQDEIVTPKETLRKWKTADDLKQIWKEANKGKNSDTIPTTKSKKSKVPQEIFDSWDDVEKKYPPRKASFSERLDEGYASMESEKMYIDAARLSYKDFIKKYEGFNLDKGGASQGTTKAHAVIASQELIPTEAESWAGEDIVHFTKKIAAKERKRYEKEFYPPLVEDLGDGKYEVIDGHHRIGNLLDANSDLDIPVYYGSRTLKNIWEEMSGKNAPSVKKRREIYEELFPKIVLKKKDKAITLEPKKKTKADPHRTLRAQLRDGEILVKDKKGNVGALPIDEFDATVFEKV